ncbi:gliding motility-associated protein GldM [Chitinophaga skermanii]|uniref:Gliding motility-associated protein GldM n=1 Tax=Chitinophaga skermanii TaxID=331697 RepID=A0A327QJR0_9BACT|nr:gliding motility protein GldM [Chitinophaga skermanii]RAJ03902.1 gliding motility-associated protein GldM [Chitinophaga skermanii]
MALPKDPRQKMINFMYLVLTAMLALNVSAEILNAFDIVNNSIVTSNTTLETKNSNSYKVFEKQLGIDPAKVGPFKEKADKVKADAAAMVKYLESIKTEIKVLADGSDKGELVNKGELNASSNIMQNQGRGAELQKKLEGLRAALLANVSDGKKAEFTTSLPLKLDLPKEATQGPVKKDWTAYHFVDVPAIAAITLLSKFQNDIRNSEAIIVEDLLKQIHENDITFDQMQAFVSLNSKNLMEGQTVEAQIMIGAYSSTATPTITVGGTTIPVTNGIGKFSATAAGIGEKSISGTIQLTKPNGEVVTQNFNETYNVGASATSISADKMNLFYVGLPNPLSITAAGYPAESVNATISGGGSITKNSAGHYTVNVNGSAPKVTINVTANHQGKTVNVGQKEFRVKYIPDPVMKVGFNKGPNMKSAEFKVQQGLRADLENFEFEGVRYEVISYLMGIDAKGRDFAEESANSAFFPPKLAGAIKALKSGDLVYFDNIRVKGPDGRVRDMQSITFKIN